MRVMKISIESDDLSYVRSRCESKKSNGRMKKMSLEFPHKSADYFILFEAEVSLCVKSEKLLQFRAF